MSVNAQFVKSAIELGTDILRAASRYPEFMPLYTSWINFAHKHGLKTPKAKPIAILRQTIELQSEEIKALEFRIATLLGDKP